MGTYQVKLERLKFFSFHGLFPEERILGNLYTVSVSVSKQRSDNMVVLTLDQTFDYGEIFKITKRIMDEPVDLLETICEKICAELRILWPDFKEIKIDILKENPPLGQISGQSNVTFLEISET